MAAETVRIEAALAQIMNDSFAFVAKNLLPAVLVLLLGFIIGKITGSIVKEILVRANVDRYFRGKDVITIRPSNLGSLATRWALYLIFVQQATVYLNLEVITEFVGTIIEYLVQVVLAVSSILIGYLIADYLKERILTAKTVYSEIAGNVTFLIVFYISIAIGLNFIEVVNADILNNLLLVLVGSAGAATAIALGLGLKDVVRDLAKDYVREMKARRRKRSS